MIWVIGECLLFYICTTFVFDARKGLTYGRNMASFLSINTHFSYIIILFCPGAERKEKNEPHNKLNRNSRSPRESMFFSILFIVSFLFFLYALCFWWSSIRIFVNRLVRDVVTLWQAHRCVCILMNFELLSGVFIFFSSVV